MGLQDYKGNEKYLRRITSQHRTKPKYMAMLKVFLDKLKDTYDVTVDLEMAFDVDTAVGVQLDFTGEKVGAYRLLTFNPVYADSMLSDEDYRKLIKAKITMNQWDGTFYGLRQLWEELFGEYRIKLFDHQTMSLRAEFHGVEDMFMAELISHGYYAPKAEGVRIDYLFVMESKVHGEMYIGGAVVDEDIWDVQLDYNDIDPEQYISGTMYFGGRVVEEIIFDYQKGE